MLTFVRVYRPSFVCIIRTQLQFESVLFFNHVQECNMYARITNRRHLLFLLLSGHTYFVAFDIRLFLSG